MHDVVDVVARLAADRWGQAGWERADHVWRERSDDLAPFSRGEGPGEIVKVQAPRQPSARLTGRLVEAGVTEGLSISSRKPAHVQAKVRITDDYVRLDLGSASCRESVFPYGVNLRVARLLKKKN